MIDLLIHQAIRLLADDKDNNDNDGEVPDDGSYMYSTLAPASSISNAEKYGFIALVAVVIVTFCVCARGFQRWQLRRERELLQIESSRADDVLGDMQVRHSFIRFLRNFGMTKQFLLKILTLASFFIHRWFQRMRNTRMTILNYYSFVNNLAIRISIFKLYTLLQAEIYK